MAQSTIANSVRSRRRGLLGLMAALVFAILVIALFALADRGPANPSVRRDGAQDLVSTIQRESLPSSSDTLDRLEMLPTRLRDATDREGGCRVVATVVDAMSGAPIENAQVTLYSLPAAGGVLVVPVASEVERGFSTTTDGDGRACIVIDSARATSWRLVASFAGRPTSEPKFFSVPAAATLFDCGNIEIPPYAIATVRVRQAGQPVANAAVYAFAFDPERYDSAAPPLFTLDLDAPQAVTDRAGEAHVDLRRGGRIRVYAAAGSAQVAFGELTSDDVHRAAGAPAVDIELFVSTPTSCFVDGPRGLTGPARVILKPRQAGFQLLRRVAVGTEVAVPDPWVGERVQAMASIDVDGRLLTAYVSGPKPPDGRLRLELEDFQRAVDVQWNAPTEAESGQPVLVTLGLVRKTMGGAICDATSSVPASAGRARLQPQGRAAHCVVGFHPDHGIATSGVDPEGGSGTAVLLDWRAAVIPAAGLDIAVDAFAGGVVEGATIAVDVAVPGSIWPSSKGGTTLQFTTTTDAAGTATFRGVPSGRATVRVAFAGIAVQELTDVALLPGKNSFTVQLAPAATLAIELAYPPEWANALPLIRVSAQRIGASASRATTRPDASGLALLPDLPPGDYDVVVECEGAALCKALSWWDPYNALTATLRPVAQWSGKLAPAAIERRRVIVSSTQVQPAVRLQPFGGGEGMRVAVTPLNTRLRARQAPRTRWVAWQPNGLDVAALPSGAHVFELLDAESAPRSWLVVENRGATEIVQWRGSSIVASERSGLPAFDRLVAWHDGALLPWISFARPSDTTGEGFRCADGRYRLFVGEQAVEGAVLSVHNGNVTLGGKGY